MVLPLTETLEEKKGLTDRKDELYGGCTGSSAVQIPETLDFEFTYSDEKVVTYATDTSYQRLCLTKQYGTWKRKNGS